jgi:hypothetical protein
MNRLRAVEHWLAAARATFGDSGAAREARVAALAEETGLSPEGVCFALERCLELEPPAAELEAFVRRARPAPAIVVVLAGNVFTAALRAVAWALAAAPRVWVRASRRSERFPRALVEAARLPGLEILPSLPPGDALERALDELSLPEGAALHAYGGTEALDALGALAARRALRTELHGPGLGVIVAHERAVVAAAEQIADDIVVFDQRGCLSPRLLMVLGDPAAAAEALHDALSRRDRSIPRGELDPAERAAIGRARDAALFAGPVLEGDGHLVLVGVAEPGPVGRVVPVVGVRTVDDARARLAPLGAALTTIGTDLPELAAAFADRRVAALGAMQTPPFDGPVDLRPLR